MGTYYVGTHHPEWLWTDGPRFPMCVSRHSLKRCKRPGRARVPWILDSGGYTVLSQGGDGDPPARWPITAEQYVAEVARWAEEIGNLVWAAPMDHMCEPWVLRRTGRTVDVHQCLTVENYCLLCQLWPQFSSLPCPFIPVLQGWSAGSYLWCQERYEQAGVDLAALPTVGLGSVCRRKSVIQISNVVTTVSPLRIHGFGFKIDALAATASRLVSADSLSWSLDARYNPPLPGHETRHKRCNNCREYAAEWLASLPLERYGWDVASF